MLTAGSLSVVGFSSPVSIAAGSHFTRAPGPSMKGKAKKLKKEKYSKKASTPVAQAAAPDGFEWGEAAETDGVDGVADMDGMVVPAKMTTSAAPVSTPADIMSTPPPANPVTGSRLPPLTGTVAASVASSGKRAEWNPNGLDVSLLPGPLKAQFVQSYLKTSPSYLDGAMPGDIGFDPWGLAVLANPSQATDAFARTAKDRDAQMLALDPEQQQQKLAWMQESELKHGRLAMLAAAGWPIAELYSGDFLHGSGGTNGRAPSLFNGHLLDYLPFLVIIFGPLAFLEFTARGKSDAQRLGVGGDYGFDPMGLSGPQKPVGAFPFDSFMGSKTAIDSVRYAKDLDAMKLAEVKNGRVAMMGITGMAVQETLWGNPVVDQTPFFFGH